MQPADQGQVQTHCLQMTHGQVAIAYTPRLVALIHFVEKLVAHYRSHQATDTGHYKARQHHGIHANCFPLCKASLARLLVGIGGGHCNLTRLGFEASNMRQEQKAEQLSFDSNALNMQIGIFAQWPGLVFA
ncbi:hypothetical protein D3C77_462580 [compost metagenome]